MGQLTGSGRTKGAEKRHYISGYDPLHLYDLLRASVGGNQYQIQFGGIYFSPQLFFPIPITPSSNSQQELHPIAQMSGHCSPLWNVNISGIDHNLCHRNRSSENVNLLMPNTRALGYQSPGF